MTGSKAKGKSQVKYIMDDEHGREHGSNDSAAEEEKSSRGRSPNGWTKTADADAGRGDLTAVGQHNTNTTAPRPKEEAAVVPAVGGGSSPGEHNKVEDQQTLREQLEALVSHKLRTLGDLDHAGLAALEALNKLPAAKDQPTANDAAKKKILPLGLEKIKKFSGKDPCYLTDCLNQFYSLVVAALPGSSSSSVNKALNRDVIFVLEGSALQFFNSLKAGEVQWEATPPVSDEGAQGGSSSSHQRQQWQDDGRGGKRFRPPSTWIELYEAFHDHYLPATGIARTSEKLFSSTQGPDESVLSLAQRQLGLATHLHRLIEANGKQIDFMEAISIRLFERALRTDLKRIQDAEPPCSSFQESVDRAELNAIKLAKKPGSTAAAQDSGGSSASSGPLTLPAVRSAVASSEGDGSGGGVFSAAMPNHAQKSDVNGGERDGGEEQSSPNAPQGHNVVGGGRDAGHEDGEVLPPDDGSQSAPIREEQGGGEAEEPSFQQHPKKATKRKRARDWAEAHRGGRGGGRGAVQPFPPPQRPPVDPGSVPPCKVQQCKTINRNFHCSNDCYYHPIFGERNKARGNFVRKKGIRRSQPNHRGPQEHHNDGFGGQ
eukprot:g9363.t1